MEKPFDLKDLEKKLKEAGLPMLEKDVEVLAKTFFVWSKESVQLAAAKQPLYALGLPVVEQLELLAQKTIDKIDGQPG